MMEIENFEDNQVGKVWMLASGAHNLKMMNPGYYVQLRDTPLEYPNPCFNQIELDLGRTYPNDSPEFIAEAILPLRHVLTTFVKRSPTIGYCQGMNFIVGNILKYCQEEEDAFWLFVSITENILPLDYYSDLLGILVD